MVSSEKFAISALARVLRRALENRVERQQRVAREVHLRDEARAEMVAEQREVNMVRTPRVRVIAPRIRARLDRQKAIAAFVVGDAAACAEEVRVERRVVLVGLVHIAAGGIGLPDFDQRIAHRAAAFVEHAARHDDALAKRLAVAHGVTRQIVIERAEIFRAVDRHALVAQLFLQRNQRTRRAAFDRRTVAGIDVGGMGREVARGRERNRPSVSPSRNCGIQAL